MNETFIEFFKRERLNAGKRNVSAVREYVRKDEEFILDKIKSHIKRYQSPLSVEEVKNAILNDRLSAEMFASDPSKQKLGQKLTLEYLGNKGYTFRKGEVDGLLYDGKKKEHFESNDIPGRIIIPFIISGNGGAQTTAIKELIPNLGRFVGVNHREYQFYFLLDGPRLNESHVFSKVEIENKLDGISNVHVMSVSDYNE